MNYEKKFLRRLSLSRFVAKILKVIIVSQKPVVGVNCKLKFLPLIYKINTHTLKWCKQLSCNPDWKIPSTYVAQLPWFRFTIYVVKLSTSNSFVIRFTLPFFETNCFVNRRLTVNLYDFFKFLVKNILLCRISNTKFNLRRFDLGRLFL